MSSDDTLRALWRSTGPFCFALWAINAETLPSAALRFLAFLLLTPFFLLTSFVWLVWVAPYEDDGTPNPKRRGFTR